LNDKVIDNPLTANVECGILSSFDLFNPSVEKKKKTTLRKGFRAQQTNACCFHETIDAASGTGK
tara:strand:- start:969 stop:1160 length:192 start_codon:yes stop_codon:yes gene_type:complete